MENDKIFEKNDIKWIKSVTRNKGKNWAYLDLNVGDTFPLNFSKNPKWYPTNYEKPDSKEIIALFQSVKNIENYKDGWYVTHLVTPIEKKVIKENDGSHPYTRLMAVVAVNSKPFPVNSEIWSFYKCNRGQICDIETIEKRDESILRMQKQEFIWNLFKNIDTDLYENIPIINDGERDFEENAVEEGRERTILKLHKFKERNPQIIRKAKENAKKENKFYCEVCLFNFELQYPILGNGFIECHHREPISSGNIRKTKIKDLAIVCSNCHRMLHRKDKTGKYYTTSDLQKIIKNKMN